MAESLIKMSLIGKKPPLEFLILRSYKKHQKTHDDEPLQSRLHEETCKKAFFVGIACLKPIYSALNTRVKCLSAFNKKELRACLLEFHTLTPVFLSSDH